jgi:hypothetical protein
VLTAAVIVITAAAGHMWWRRLWSSAFITGPAADLWIGPRVSRRRVGRP